MDDVWKSPICNILRADNKATKGKCKEKPCFINAAQHRLIVCKGTAPSTISLFETALALKDSRMPRMRPSVVALNGAVMWQLAYGSLDSWRLALSRILRTAVYRYDRVVWISATAVHPALLVDKDGWLNFQWMTPSRVVELNEIATEVIKSSTFLNTRVEILDFLSLTENRGNDPKTPTDMRHYGLETVQELANTLLGTICP
eukprot:g1063.t1